MSRVYIILTLIITENYISKVIINVECFSKIPRQVIHVYTYTYSRAYIYLFIQLNMRP